MVDRNRATPGQLFAVEDEVRPRLEKLLTRLGYRTETGYINPEPDAGASRSLPHHLEQAFKSGVSGAFCLDGACGSGGMRAIPVVYVAMVGDIGAADVLHRRVWAQNMAPLLVVAMREGIQIRNAFDLPRSQRIIPWAIVEEEKASKDLAAVTALALRTSTGWRDFNPGRANRVDARMLRAIKSLSGEIKRQHPKLKDHATLINALIGRMLYLFVLVDRGIVDQEWIAALKADDGKPLCPDVLIPRHDDQNVARRGDWPIAQAWHLFDAIDDALNGSVFPISADERALLPGDALNLIRRALRRDELIDGGEQYGFWDVSYGLIRTETISAIYELFLALDDEDAKREHGAFYTPPFLADYMLDELDEMRPLNAQSIICDPAAGSGIFLVAAFRRIVERTPGVRGDADRLRATLAQCIFGVERNRQAAGVARFSLYLTMLDYLPGKRLRDLAPDGKQLFPPLSGNILERDFFDGALPTAIARRATHVAANPPWVDIEDGSPAAAYAETLAAGMVSENRLSELFVWRMKDALLEPKGAMAVLLSTKSFVSPAANRQRQSFPNLLAARTRIRGAVNLAHFRNRLFPGARNPALALFATNDEPDGSPAWLAAPLLTSQPVSHSGWPWSITIDRGDVVHVPMDDLTRVSRAWFWNLMLQPIDRKYAKLLADRTKSRTNSCQTLGDLLADGGMTLRNGDSPARTGVPAHLSLGADRNKANDYRKAVRPDDQTVSARADPYHLPADVIARLRPAHRAIFSGNALIITRNMSDFDVVKQPMAFNSSLNAIVFNEGSSLAESDRLAALRNLAAYLRSSLAAYLFALHGRLWLIDGRRFETGDLNKIPVPFESVASLMASGVETMTDRQITDSFVHSFNLDPLFAEAVSEYAAFRIQYKDGQIPEGSATPPTGVEKQRYEAAFQRRMTAYLGEDARAAVLRGATHGTGVVEVSIATHAGSNVTSEIPSAPERGPVPFAWSTEVHLGSADDRPSIVKPMVRAAWTVERAYADAERLANALLAE